MDFDDLYQGSRKRGFSGGRKLRLFCIFLVVAALTVFILWRMIPKQTAGKTAESVSVPEKQNDIQERAEKAPVSAESAKSKTAKTKVRPQIPAKKAKPIAKKRRSAVKNVQNDDFSKGSAGPGDISAAEDKPVIPAEPKLNKNISKRLQDLEKLEKQKKYAEAAAAAGALLNSLTEGSETYRKVLAVLTRANWQRFLQKDTSGGFAVAYSVRSGDRLSLLARKFRTTVAAVMFANKLKSSNRIWIGQRLVFLPGVWQIRVSKNKRLLWLMRNKTVFGGFDVGVGRFGKTPSADFVIAERLKHPVYRTLDGRIYKHGEKGNELGDYFLKLAPAGTPGAPLLGYGIHGTPDETTVTRSLSNGCIRMRNKDVEKLYCLVPSGVPVVIRD